MLPSEYRSVTVRALASIASTLAVRIRLCVTTPARGWFRDVDAQPALASSPAEINTAPIQFKLSIFIRRVPLFTVTSYGIRRRHFDPGLYRRSSIDSKEQNPTAGSVQQAGIPPFAGRCRSTAMAHCPNQSSRWLTCSASLRPLGVLPPRLRVRA